MPNLRESYVTETIGQGAKSPGILRDWNWMTMCQISDGLTWLKLNGNVPNVLESYVTENMAMCQISGNFSWLKLQGNVSNIRRSYVTEIERQCAKCSRIKVMFRMSGNLRCLKLKGKMSGDLAWQLSQEWDNKVYCILYSAPNIQESHVSEMAWQCDN